MNIWFTADQHFGHKNIINYANRPFASVNEMDAVIIDNWNKVVSHKDIVYCVGDFTLQSMKFARIIFGSLKGFIYFIPGSHDRWLEDFESGYPPTTKSSGFVHLLPPIYSFEPNGIATIVLCHYAMRSWHLSHYGSWHLFGHHHGNLEPYGLSFDIGVDTHNFFPWSIDEIAEKMNTLKPIVDYSKR